MTVADLIRGLAERTKEALAARCAPLEAAQAAQDARLRALEAQVALLAPVPGPPGPQGPPGPPGERGAPGAPGAAATAEDLQRAVAALPVFLFAGPWEAGVEYRAGQSVVCDGSTWTATAATTEKPGVGKTAWTLTAKRGRDGRDRRAS